MKDSTQYENNDRREEIRPTSFSRSECYFYIGCFCPISLFHPCFVQLSFSSKGHFIVLSGCI